MDAYRAVTLFQAGEFIFEVAIAGGTQVTDLLVICLKYACKHACSQ